MGLLRVKNYWATSLSLFTFMHWRRKWQPTPVFLPGESQGRRSLVGCPLWVRTESDTTECLHFHFSLSCIGEGNGNSLQCSCLENPRDWEPGGLPSMGLHRVGHDWSDLAVAHRTGPIDLEKYKLDQGTIKKLTDPTLPTTAPEKLTGILLLLSLFNFFLNLSPLLQL